MDSERVPGADLETVEKRLLYAIAQMRALSVWRDVPLLFIPENAPGPIGATFEYLLMQYQRRTNGSLGRILTMREYGKDRKPGVPKTKEITNQMVRLASMMVADRRVVVSENLRVMPKKKPQQLVDKLVHQMRDYHCEVKANKNDPFSDPKFKWMGRQDDLLVAMMTALYWHTVFWESQYEGYEQFKRIL